MTRRVLVPCAKLWVLLWLTLQTSLSAWAEPKAELVTRGLALHRSGDIHTAIDLLNQARSAAGTPEAASGAATALGVIHLQARRLDAADEALSAGYRDASGPARATAALELGNLAQTRKQGQRAETLYRETLTLSGNDTALGLAARINLARLGPADVRLERLNDIAVDLHRLPDAVTRSSLHLHLGQLALETGPSRHPLAYRQFEQARQITATAPASQAHLGALDGLGALYEAQQRWPDVIALATLALDASKGAPLGPIHELVLEAEWRLGRAYRQTGRTDLALAAYTRAVEHAQAIRPDLPIETADGRSTYQSLLQPLLEGYVELQFDALATTPAERQGATLVRLRDAVEALRQAEMQDFLGDRCTVEEDSTARLDVGVAVVYPILLPDRVELLTETRDGLRRYTNPISRAEVTSVARTLATQLRTGVGPYQTAAKQLYDWLIRPLDEGLGGIHTLIVVPDGVLRLVPFAALHDGKASLVERVAVSTVTGMSMTNSLAPPTGGITSLLAGVAEPGPVVEKLAATEIMRAASGASRGGSARAMSDRDIQVLRESLALPGVRDEVQAIAKTLGGKVLLDKTFTIQAFQNETEGGDYRIIHLASHGVFGGTSETSFILAYDDLLGINRLQSVLRSEKVQQSPIELLTLSACETAEGNERAPLGIAGAAIRARAKSVLGTLWPVDDEAARSVMERFYRGISVGRLSKTAALRQAQLALMKNPDTEHPIFWAPFNLVGNWR